MGFKHVYDTSFTADMTIFEDTNELLTYPGRRELPMFTSCCPAWVKYVVMHFLSFLPMSSSLFSPGDVRSVAAVLPNSLVAVAKTWSLSRSCLAPPRSSRRNCRSSVLTASPRLTSSLPPVVQSMINSLGIQLLELEPKPLICRWDSRGVGANSALQAAPWKPHCAMLPKVDKSRLRKSISRFAA